MKQGQIWTFLVTVLTIVGTPAFAQDDAIALNNQTEAGAPVYGWQIMNEQERQLYQEQIQLVKNESERNQFLQSHHSKMQARAREQGVSLTEPQGHKGRANSRQGKGGGRTQGNRPAFADFDTNGDGYLEEMEYARAHAERIAERAKEGRAMRNLGNSTFADIDTDSDGRLNPNEFAVHQARQHQGKQHRKHQD